MALTGHLLGPGDPGAALAAAKVGARVPERLDVDAFTVYLAWPVAVLAGALVVLLGTAPASTGSPAGSPEHADGVRRRGSRVVRADPRVPLGWSPAPTGPGRCTRPGGTTMSTNDPGPEPEYLGSRPEPADARAPAARRRERGRRTGLVAAAAVAVVAAVGAGAYGVVAADGRRQLAGDRGARGRGRLRQPRPRPVGRRRRSRRSRSCASSRRSRRSSARRRRRPAQDGLRGDRARAATARTSTTPSDVEPWIGDRVAVAAVPDSQAGRAAAGGAAGHRPGEGQGRLPARSRAATVRRTRSLAHRSGVQRRLPAGRRDPAAGGRAWPRTPESAALADSEDFTAATERTGDPGIVTMYASKDAPDAL